jgi:TDG/mug DNA glycosylase family protein
MVARGRPAPLQGFGPIADRQATLLILGSMPGAASLAATQYYAHPRNAFWPILDAVRGIPSALDYAARVRAVRAAGIAIWDVLASCQRSTSLDADIEKASMVVNNFAGFFRRHPRIRLIAFNGGTAQTLYRRHVLPTLPQTLQQIPAVRMPSTSPAHAALSLQCKVQRWRELLSAAT